MSIPGFVESFARRAHRAHAQDESGFAFIEVVVAAVILLIVVTAVGGQLGIQFLSVSTSTDQQAANGLLSQAMEEVRALPYTFVATGLSLTDMTVTGDPNIVISGSTCRTNNAAVWNPAEVIPCAAPAGESQAPFVPHISISTVDGTAFSVAGYPSIDATDTGSGPNVYRVTFMVSWHSSQPGPTRIVAQTLVYSASSGCLTDTNHPFAAPCQPFLYAGASAGGGVIDVIPDSGSTNPVISGDPFNSVELLLAQAYSDAQIEQVSTILGAARTSGGSISATSTQSTGGLSATSNADNDPGTSRNGSNPTSVTQSGSVIQEVASGQNANWISVVPGSSDAGSSISTASASSNPACNDLSGSPQLNILPCGNSTAAQSGSGASLLMGLFAGSSSVGTTPLASVGAQPMSYPDQTFVTRVTSAGGTYCTSTSGDGCVHAGAQESLGAVQLAGLPSQFITDGAVPSTWGAGSTNCPAGNYMLAVFNFSAGASSESGVGPGSPSTSVPMSGAPTPYLCYWTLAGYQSVPISWGASPPAVTVPTVTATDGSVPSGAVTVTMTPHLTLQATSATSSLSTGCSSVCTAAASVPSPVVGDIIYTVTQGSTSIADLDIQVDLGSLTLGTSYQAAP